MAISLQNVGFSYLYGEKALYDISLEIPTNEHVAILGFEGSGKTTLCKVIAGLIKPTEGKVLINNNPITKPSFKKYDIQMIFSHGGIFKLKSFKGNIAYGFKKQKFSKDTIQSYLNNPYDNISKASYSALGFSLDSDEIVRLNMERVYHRKANILIIDNIFDLLSIEKRSEYFCSYIRLIKNSNNTLIFATNSIDEALAIAKNIIYIENGRILDIINKDSKNMFPNSYRLLKALEPFINEFTFDYDEKKVYATYRLLFSTNNDTSSIKIEDKSFLKDEANHIFYQKEIIYKTKYGYIASNINTNKISNKFIVDKVAFYDFYTGMKIDQNNSIKSAFYKILQAL